MRENTAIFTDFSYTITTVESENMAIDGYLNFMRSRYSLSEDFIPKFKDMRNKKLVDREDNYRTFMKINEEVLFELYKIEEIYPEDYYRFHETLLKLRLDFLKFAATVRKATKLVMVTDADIEFTKRTLSKLGIDKLFDKIITAESVEAPKPNPKIFETALKAVDNPSEVVFVGDSERRDIGGAKRMNFFTVLMDNYSESTSADAKVRNFDELLNILRDRNII